MLLNNRICAKRIIIDTRMSDDASQLTVSEKMLYLLREKIKISILLILLSYRCWRSARDLKCLKIEN